MQGRHLWCLTHQATGASSRSKGKTGHWNQIFKSVLLFLSWTVPTLKLTLQSPQAEMFGMKAPFQKMSVGSTACCRQHEILPQRIP